MKRSIKQILILSLLLILPIGHSVVYGGVRIKRLYNNNYYYLTTREYNYQSWKYVYTPHEFTNVSNAVNFTGTNSITLYYDGIGTTTATKSLQNYDIIELTSDTEEKSQITISKTEIQITSSDGRNTITATNGTYNNNCLLYINGGSVTIGGTITLDANASNLNNTQLSVVSLAGTDPSLTLNGTLTGGDTTGNSSLGGGITVGAGTATINGTIQNCSAQNGGGVYVAQAATITVETVEGSDAKVQYNNADNGGGIYVAKGATANMTSGSIIGNTAANGGGAYLAAGDQTGQTDTHNGGKLNISGSAQIGGEGQGNTASGNGGGVYVAQAATITVEGFDAKVQYNNAVNGGGLYINTEWSKNSLGAVTIQKNTADNNGGGIYLESSYKTTFGAIQVKSNNAKNGGGIYADKWSGLTLDDEKVSISQNTSSESGGGIFAKGGTHLKISNGTISRNGCYETSGGSQGGGIYIEGGDITVNKATISNNYLGEEGTGAENSSRKGAGLFITGIGLNGDKIQANISECTISGNKINYSSAANQYYYGGGIYVQYSTLKISDCTIRENQSVKGGGVTVSGNATLIAEGTDDNKMTFTSNTAANNGGALWAEGSNDWAPTLTITGVTFSGNTAEGSGGAIDIHAVDAASEIKNCTFTDNTTKAYGGALNVEEWWEGTVSFTIDGSTFTGNKIGTESGGNMDHGIAINVDNQSENANLHTVVLSGTNTFEAGQTIRLNNKTVLTKGSSDMAFSGSGTAVSVYPKDIYNGRDILVSLQSATSANAVNNEDMEKFNVIASGAKAVFNASGNDDASASQKAVIELLLNYLLTIECEGLKTGESAAYIVKDAKGNTLYNVILTGIDDNGTKVSRAIDYADANAKSVTSSWEWTYTKPTNTAAVNWDTNNKATCSFVVAKNSNKLNPHGEHSITFGNPTTNE